jgi:hypothetical protein
MSYELLREQLQDNLISYMSEVNACEFHDSYIDPDVIDTVCQIVVDTFKEVLV